MCTWLSMRFMMTYGNSQSQIVIVFFIRFVDGTEYASCLEQQCKSCLLFWGQI